MGKIRDFLRWTPTPTPTAIQRATVNPLELRDANAALHVSHQVGRPQWPRYDYDVFNRQAYEKISLIYRCSNLVASSVAEAPVRVYNETDGEGESITNHPLRQLLTRPNPLMGEASLWHGLTLRMAVFGFGLLEIERGSYGRPVQLWPLRSEWAKPIPRDNDLYDWEYTVPGRAPVILLGDDVVVVPWAPSPTGDPRGVGPLEVALREWSLLTTMQDYLKGFFDGGALPVYGLIPGDDTDLNADDANSLREQWVEATTWRHGLPPKPPIMKSIKGIERLSFDYNELAYTELRDVSEVAILQAFGVPGSMVGQRLAQERNTFSNAAEMRTSFYQDTIQKRWAQIDDALTRSLLPEFETNRAITLEFDTSKIDALQDDQGPALAHMLDAYRSGAATKADYRRLAGLPVMPGDDVYMVPFNLIETPVGKPMRDTVYIAQPEAKPDEDEPGPEPPPDDERKRVMRERRDRQSDAMQRRSLNIYAALALRFGPELFAFFLGQLERLFAAVPELTERPNVPASSVVSRVSVSVALDWDAEDAELKEVVRRIYGAASQEAKISVEAETGLSIPTSTTTPATGGTGGTTTTPPTGGGSGATGTSIGAGVSDVDIWDIENPYVKELDDKLGGRVTGINQTTQRDIERVVKEALDEGVSIDELAKRLEGMVEETYKGRATTIARTESMVAYSEASVLNYKAMGFTQVELRDNPNHTTDPGSDGLTCAQRHGLVVPIEQASKHIWAEHPRGSLSVRAYDDIYEW